MSQHLPLHPNLGHLKKQAKDVLRVARHGNPQWRLTDAQQAVAHGYGFSNWPALKRQVESTRRQRGAPPHDPRMHEDATRDPFTAVASTVIQNRQRRSSYPIAGTWATRPSASSSGERLNALEGGDMMVEFELIDDTVTLTQVVVDAGGRQSAMKTAVQADGRDHPVEFGDHLVLQATWTDDRTLELIFKHAGTSVSKWMYRVSGDGQLLTVSTTDRVVILERA
jgi:hypothetical protein